MVLTSDNDIHMMKTLLEFKWSNFVNPLVLVHFIPSYVVDGANFSTVLLHVGKFPMGPNK